MLLLLLLLLLPPPPPPLPLQPALLLPLASPALRDSHNPPQPSRRYNLLNYLKAEFVLNASLINPFNSSHFFWIDGGYGHGLPNVWPPHAGECMASCVTCHTRGRGRAARHASHVARHASRVTRHTSHAPFRQTLA